MSELKACPFCGEMNCVHLTVLRGENMPDYKWNQRPIESALQSALTTAQEENKRYRDVLEWIANSNTNGYTTGEGHSDCVYKARSALNGGKNG